MRNWKRALKIDLKDNQFYVKDCPLDHADTKLSVCSQCGYSKKFTTRSIICTAPDIDVIKSTLAMRI